MQSILIFLLFHLADVSLASVDGQLETTDRTGNTRWLKISIFTCNLPFPPRLTK